jgi:hypothetical protein
MLEPTSSSNAKDTYSLLHFINGFENAIQRDYNH